MEERHRFTFKERWRIWDLAILVLGLNFWVSFLLLPVIHLHQPGPSMVELVFLFITLITLVVGVYFSHRQILLAIYPMLLLLPTLVDPRLVGVNVYSGWTFALVAASFLAYCVGVPLMLHVLDPLLKPIQGKDLKKFPSSPKWRRRMRMYRWLTGLSVLFPLVLLCTLFIHPGVKADLAHFYPGRFAEASSLFGVLVLLFWLGIFYSYFMNPMKAHIRSDPQMRHELQRLHKETFRRYPRPSFYIFVSLSLVLMLGLVLVHW